MRRLKLALLVAAGIVFVYVFLPYRLFYRSGRPTRAGRALNGFWARAFGTGLLPPLLVSLEVPGRRTGEVHRTALVAGRYQGYRYLVSMLGDRSSWVRNVRAADGEAVIHRGGRLPVRLVEVAVEERAPIIKSYLRVARGARVHVPVPFDAPVEEFDRVAYLYPVFRIERAAQPVVRLDAAPLG